MTTEPPNPERSPFEVLLDSWPGGDLIGDRWRNGSRHIAIVTEPDGQWIVEAVLESFPTATWATHTVVVAPELAVRLCAWHAAEYGPYVVTDDLTTYPAAIRDADDTTVAATVATLLSQLGSDNADEALDELAKVAAAATAAGAPLAHALELNTVERDTDELTAVLRTTHAT